MHQVNTGGKQTNMVWGKTNESVSLKLLHNLNKVLQLFNWGKTINQINTLQHLLGGKKPRSMLYNTYWGKINWINKTST